MLPISEVQGAIYTALTAALAPVPVLDLAGPDERFPYVTLGEFTATPDDPVTSEQGVDMDMSLHVWSRQPGMQEIQQIMQAAKDALHYKKFAVTGFQWVETAWEMAQTMRDIDGVTRHGVMRFRILTFQTTT
jgi:hypothetical protein